MVNPMCLLLGHSLKINKSIAYKNKALECKRCGKQSSIWKQTAIEDALIYNDGKRFLPSGIKDNQFINRNKNEVKK